MASLRKPRRSPSRWRKSRNPAATAPRGDERALAFSTRTTKPPFLVVAVSRGTSAQVLVRVSEVQLQLQRR
ncbi:hypothetical protein ISF_08947 [Cordyceps fumosorosea ARSEF 2679]|uniref:Uncharacterized protein n=1 Tax=Cordyceps fumosorosea (strain ARSEF 2679) TaxID=1081104 RepID=A0A162I769_CORFA|nr:hypothetical protein ISF_08947 [Cordyceps fumosorosea ARSEF 2679]OAA53215.1 hypothetical protein ISF_08947 [Cordyceps fumosorosea ARSEF 2679]